MLRENKQRQRLAALLAADAAGYSRLMANDASAMAAELASSSKPDIQH